MVRLLVVVISGLVATAKLAAARPAFSFPNLGLLNNNNNNYDVETDFLTQTLTNLKTVYRSKLPSSLTAAGATPMVTSTVQIAGFPMTIVRPFIPTSSVTASAIPVILGANQLTKTTVTVTSDVTAFILGATPTATGHPILQIGSTTLFNDPLHADNVIVGAETLTPGAAAKTLAGQFIRVLGGNSLVVGPAINPLTVTPNSIPIPSLSFGFGLSWPAQSTIQIPTGSPTSILSLSSIPSTSFQIPTVTATAPITPIPQLSVLVPTVTVGIPVITAAPSSAQQLSLISDAVSIIDSDKVAPTVSTEFLTVTQSILDGTLSTLSLSPEQLPSASLPLGSAALATITQSLTVTQPLSRPDSGLSLPLTQPTSELLSSVVAQTSNIPTFQTSNLLSIQTSDVPSVQTSNIIPSIQTSNIVPSIQTSNIVPSIQTSNIVSSIQTSNVVPSIQTSNVVPSVQTSSIPSIQASSIPNIQTILGPGPVSISSLSASIVSQVPSSVANSPTSAQSSSTKTCNSGGQSFESGQRYSGSGNAQYTIHCSQDNSQPAFSIYGVRSGGFQRCLDACDATPQCQGWTFSGADSGNCYLKTKEGSYSPAPSTVVSGFKTSSQSSSSSGLISSPSGTSSSQASQTASSASSTSPTPSTSSDDCMALASDGTNYTSTKGTPYRLSCKHDIGGNDISAISSPTFKGCFTACDMNSECAGFSWLVDDGPGTCYLKSALNGQPGPSNADIAIKSGSSNAGISSGVSGQQSSTAAASTPSASISRGKSCRDIGTSNNFATSDANYTVSCGLDHGGGDTSNAPSSSFSDCFGKCDKIAGCIGFAYLGGSGPGTCYFKSTVSPAASYNPNVDFASLARPRTSSATSGTTGTSISQSSTTSTAAGTPSVSSSNYSTSTTASIPSTLSSGSSFSHPVSTTASTPSSVSSSSRSVSTATATATVTLPVSSPSRSASTAATTSSSVILSSQLASAPLIASSSSLTSTSPSKTMATQILTVTVTGPGPSSSIGSSRSSGSASKVSSALTDGPKAMTTMTVFTTWASMPLSTTKAPASVSKPTALLVTTTVTTGRAVPSKAPITGLAYEGNGNQFIAIKQTPSGVSLMDGALTASLRPGRGMYFDGHYVNIAPQDDGLVIDATTQMYTTYVGGAGPTWATPTMAPSPVMMESIVWTTLLATVTDDKNSIMATSVVAAASIVTVTHTPIPQSASPTGSSGGFVGPDAFPVQGIKNPMPPAGVNNKTMCDFLVHREPLFLRTEYVSGFGSFFTGGAAGLDHLYLAAPSDPNQVNIPRLTHTPHNAAEVVYNVHSGTVAMHVGDECDFTGLSLTDYYRRREDLNFGSRALWVPGLATAGFFWDGKALLRDKNDFFSHWLVCQVPGGDIELHWQPKTFSLFSPSTWHSEKIDYSRCAKVYLKPVRRAAPPYA